jgi:peptidoglycan/xylan/chitin deacetylase (PgdA/CDA1 family)
VQFLQRYYRVVDFCEAVEMLKTGRVEKPTVVLAFDDGRGDNYLNLRAVMHATGVPMTLFVCTDHIEKQREFDQDRKWGQSGFLPLTREPVRGLDRDRFRIGSHTRSHFDCGSTDSALLQLRIVESEADLETRLRHEVSLSPFPWELPPNMFPQATDLAEQTYPCVCSALGSANHATPSERRWHVRRRAHPNTIWELELTLQSILELGW